MDQEPLPRLVYAILLSAVKKKATELRVHRVDGEPRVDFLIDGIVHNEIRSADLPYEAIVRRLAVMGQLPVYRKGEHAIGRIKLTIRDTRELDFDVLVEGHGPTLAASVRFVSDSQPAGEA